MLVCYKCYILVELTFLKELMLIRQANQRSVTFATIGSFQKKALNQSQIVCNRCHDLLTMSMNLSNITVLN